jgi:hypothetical protein
VSANPTPDGGVWDLGAIVGGQPLDPPPALDSIAPTTPTAPAASDHQDLGPVMSLASTGPPLVAPPRLPVTGLSNPPPAHAGRWRPGRSLVPLGVVLVTGALLATLLIGLRPDGATPVGGAASVAQPVTPSPIEPTRSTVEGSASPAADPRPSGQSAEEAALDTLRQLREQDLQTVQFIGQYGAQLASKTVGIVDQRQTAVNGSHAFYASDILAEHLALRNSSGLGVSVILLLSTDYGKRQLYQGQPLWLTMGLGQFGSAQTVRAWCAARFPQLSGDDLENQCTPRRLGPPNG